MTPSDPLAIFPEAVRKPVEGLMWLGYLEDDFEFAAHHFGLRTLYSHEELIAAKLAKEWNDTLGQTKAYAWGHVCLALTSIDHNPNFCPPIGPDEMEYARARFRYCTRKMFWPMGEYLFQRYTGLARAQAEAFKAFANLADRSPASFSPSPDSSTEPDTSDEPMPSEDLF